MAPHEQTPLLVSKSSASTATASTACASPSIDKERKCGPPSHGGLWVGGAVLLVLLASTVVWSRSTRTTVHASTDQSDDSLVETVSVAFIGNSMLYFNDFPRFFQALASDADDAPSTRSTRVARPHSKRRRIVQNSCLHGGASISSMLIEGNAMYPQFRTPSAQFTVPARLVDGTEATNATLQQPFITLYDYGACTVPQLLVGRDERLHDPGYALPTDESVAVLPSGLVPQTNPCRMDATYLEYTLRTYSADAASASASSSATPKHWDYVVINDNTRNPSQFNTRSRALANLERFYVPYLLETGATPVFLWTHAYTPASTGPCIPNTTKASLSAVVGLDDIANFTSLTRVGYQAYVDLLALYLPASQTPRIAPVGLAFLTIYEENIDVWHTLFHCDGIHASPSGTFLQGCVIYYTLFGEMPPRHRLLQAHDIDYWWKDARMMQHAWEPSNPLPDAATAAYLYRIAERILQGHVPASYIAHSQGEFAAPAHESDTNHGR